MHGEYHQAKCDSLKLTPNRMDCIKLKDKSGTRTTLRMYSNVVSTEIMEDMAIPTLLTARILLWQLRDVLGHKRLGKT